MLYAKAVLTLVHNNGTLRKEVLYKAEVNEYPLLSNMLEIKGKSRYTDYKKISEFPKKTIQIERSKYNPLRYLLGIFKETTEYEVPPDYHLNEDSLVLFSGMPYYERYEYEDRELIIHASNVVLIK